MKEPVITPPILRPGDTIGIAAPASPFDVEAFEQGVAVLESLGFAVSIPKSIFKRQGYHAGADAERAEILMELFADPGIRAILCARGGFGCIKLLSLLDFESIKKHPKVFVGFSDVTTLLVAIYQRCRMVTFHGPLVTSLAKSSDATISGLMHAVATNTPVVLTPARPEVLKPGRATGPVLGGNLATLIHLVGTPYAPDLSGHILFLEDRGEALYRIDRMISHLYLSGHLDGVAGVLLGSFEDCGDIKDVYGIVKKAFQDRPVPILAGADLGHGEKNITLPVGLEATLDTEDLSVCFKGPAVEGVIT